MAGRKISIEDRQDYWRRAGVNEITRVAEQQFGETNATRSTRQELRFGNQGSTAVQMTGEKAGKWYDFELNEGGVLALSDAAFDELRGHNNDAPRQPPQSQPKTSTNYVADPPNPQKTLGYAKAKEIVEQSQLLAGTIADRYLRDNRGRNPDSIPDLRFHPSQQYKGRALPCLIVPMRCVFTGRGMAVHRTYIDPVTAEKIDRRMRGPAKDTAIMLNPFDAPTYGLAICEGIETALAVRQIIRPVWALGSAGAIAKFPVLGGIEYLTIFADSDEKGTGLRAAEECVERWRAAGCDATIHSLPNAGDFDDALPKDWNN